MPLEGNGMDSDFGRVIDALPGLVWSSRPDGQADFLNRRWLEYTGLSQDEAIGAGWTVAVHPGDVQRLLDYWQSLLASGQPGETEARLRRRDGAYRWFRFRISPVTDSAGGIVRWCGINTDIEDLKRAEDASRTHERQRADDEVRASERNARAIVDGFPGLVAVFSSDGFLEQVNQQAVAFWGKSPEQLKDWAGAGVLHPEDAPRKLAAFAKAFASKSPFEIEVRARRHDGVYRWLLSRGFPVQDGTGRIVRWYNLLVDIDARKRVEEELAASRRNLQLIIDATPALIWSSDASGSTDAFNQHYIDYVGFAAEELKGWGWAVTIHPDDRDELSRVWSGVLASGEAGQAEARLRRHDGTYRWFLMRASPMRDESGAIVKWYGVNTDIEDRKRAEAAAQVSERNLKRSIDATPALIWSTDATGASDTFNQHYLDFAGLPLEQLTGWGWTVTIHPDDQAGLTAAWQKIMTSGTAGQAEARLRRYDGTYRWFLMRAQPLRDESGEIVRWYGVNTDIEDRKNADDALRANERNLSLIIDATPALIWSSTPDGNTESVNQHFLDYVGVSWETLKEKTWALAIHPDDQAGFRDVWNSLRATGQPGETEARLRRHDGVYRWFLLRSSPLHDENGNIVKWYGVNTDIEDRKQAEQKVAASERNFKLTIDTTPALIWSPDAKGRIEWVNQHYLDYVGLPLEQMPQKGWEIIHPDDLENLSASWKAILAAGKTGQTEARLRRHDGEYRWFLFRANPMRDEQGNIVKWYGVNTDIEDRKRAEEAVAASERNLRQTINAIPAMVYCNSADGPNEYLNQRWHEYTGLSPQQARGQGWQTPIHPDDLPRMMRHWMSMLHAGTPGEVEGRLRRFDGLYRWFLFRSDALRDDEGKVIKWYGTTTDINDRKRAEQELQRGEAVLTQAEAVSGTGSFLWNLETGEIRWSNELYRIFEFEQGTPVTLERIATRVHPEDLPLLDEMAKRAQSGQGSEYEHRILLPDGTVKYLHFVAKAMRDQEGRPEYFGAVQNVTERRSAEQALSKVRSELAHVARVSSLGALTASIAHEVNQPLAGIVTNASTCLRMLAADQPNIEGARETARRTIRDGNRAAEVITRLRALFTKKEAVLESVDLNDAAREVVALSVNELQRWRIVLRQEYAADLPRLSGDRVQLQQVILNLILNATDAMSDIGEGARLLTIKTGSDEEGHVQLSVRDCGVGIDAQSAPKLFEAFYTTKPEGMGIGLSVSRTIIERHQGRLWAQPNEGPGATFSFSIPRSSNERTGQAIFGTPAAPHASQGTSRQ